MPHFAYSLIMLLLGIGLVSFIDVIGSVLSRRFDFHYGFFSILSFVAYTAVAYLVVKETKSFYLTMIVVIATGCYDGSVGWWIAQKLKANYRYKKEAAEKMTLRYRLYAASLFATLCGIVGYELGSRV